jgi:rod shape-determining protein MreD
MRVWALDQFYIWRIASMLVAFFLMQLPLPYALSQWQPQWVLLVCLFWLWNHPSRFSLLWVGIIALMTDYASGLPLGVHVVSFVLLAGLVIWRHNQIMHYDFSHQLLFSIFLFICNIFMTRVSFELCHLEWSWMIMLKTQISTCLLWACCIWRFNFHGFWFAHVG